MDWCVLDAIHGRWKPVIGVIGLRSYWIKIGGPFYVLGAIGTPKEAGCHLRYKILFSDQHIHRLPKDRSRNYISPPQKKIACLIPSVRLSEPALTRENLNSTTTRLQTRKRR